MAKQDTNKKSKKNAVVSDKVSFINSIAAKIMLLVAVCITITVTVCTVILVNNSKTELQQTTMNYMKKIATAQKDKLNQKMYAGVNAEFYEAMLGDVTMEGVDSTYAYLVSKKGIMIYHPNAEKIGAPVENEVVKGLVEQLAAGNKPEDGVTRYLYKGEYKYAGYGVTNNDQILVVTADESDVLANINRIKNIGIIAAVIMIVLSIVAAYVLCTLIVKPIKQLIDIIEKTAEFDFRHNNNSDKLVKRKDENGVMARSIGKMRSSLRTMVGSIENASTQINSNVTMLQDVTNEVNSMCTDNSATTEELAAGMQETAATTESIYANIGYMQTGAKDITALSENGDLLSNEVMERATAMRQKTMTATKRTKEEYESVRVRSDKAIEESKAVEKINALTEAIMSISSRTSLLALNASIEAARAGEAGRGFAVVATEIGNLAEQTSEAVADINGIVGEVNQAVANMSECLIETSDFLEKTVLSDYAEFGQVSEQYNEDALKFKTSMNDVHESIINLADMIVKISDALSGINSTIGESTLGVTDIAGKTTDMVTRTSETNDLVEESRGYVEQLKDIVREFRME